MARFKLKSYCAYLMNFSESVLHSREICGDTLFMRWRKIMPTDAEVIAKARELLKAFYGPIGGDWDIGRMATAIAQLADIAEKRGAMAVQERAKILYDSHEAEKILFDGLRRL
jgi:hypothetical protein